MKTTSKNIKNSVSKRVSVRQHLQNTLSYWLIPPIFKLTPPTIKKYYLIGQNHSKQGTHYIDKWLVKIWKTVADQI